MDPKFWSDLGQVVKWVGILWIGFNILNTILFVLFMETKLWDFLLLFSIIVAIVIVIIAAIALLFWHSTGGAAIVIIAVVGGGLVIWEYIRHQ